MANPKEIKVGGIIWNLYWTTGTVADTNKHSTTHVYGGGSVNDGGGSVSVSSSTTIHDQLFIIDKDGAEHSFRLSGFDVAARAGHEVSVVWIIRKGKEERSYVAALNHTTKDRYFSNAAILKIVFARQPKILKYGTFVFLTLTAIAVWCGMYSFFLRSSWTEIIIVEFLSLLVMFVVIVTPVLLFVTALTPVVGKRKIQKFKEKYFVFSNYK